MNHLTTQELETMLAQRKEAEKAEQERERNSYESMKNDTVTRLAKHAELIHHELKAFKEIAFSEAETLYELLQKYSKRHADGKGSFTMQNQDNSIRMMLKRQELGRFDERSVQAERHIKDFILNRFNGDDDAKDIIMGILERKKGYLDIKQIQRLYAMENRFDDQNWREGIRLLKESWQPSESKSYISFTINGKLINLDFASI